MSPTEQLRFGVDSYSIRFHGWEPSRQLTYLSRWPKFKFASLSYNGLDALQTLNSSKSLVISIGPAFQKRGEGYIPNWETVDTVNKLARAGVQQASVYALDVDLTYEGLSEALTEHNGFLKAMGHAARDAKVKLSFENHRYMPPALINQILAADEAFCLCLDLGNPLASGDDPVQFANWFARKIAIVHVKDTLIFAKNDRLFWRSVPLGDGQVPLIEIIKRLQTVNPAIIFLLEISTSRPPEPIDKTIDFLRSQLPWLPPIAELEALASRAAKYIDRTNGITAGVQDQEISHLERSVKWVEEHFPL